MASRFENTLNKLTLMSSLANLTCPQWQEIRNGDKETLNFLKAAFPSARFVINYRNDTRAQKRSGFFKKEPEKANNVESATFDLMEFANLNPAATYTLPLEEFGPGKFSDLFHWIGFPNCNATRLPRLNKRNGYSRVSMAPPPAGPHVQCR